MNSHKKKCHIQSKNSPCNPSIPGRDRKTFCNIPNSFKSGTKDEAITLIATKGAKFITQISFWRTPVSGKRPLAQMQVEDRDRGRCRNKISRQRCHACLQQFRKHLKSLKFFC